MINPTLTGASGSKDPQQVRPPACHLYWSGSEFPLCRYLAVKSALKVHDPERLFLWTGSEEPTTNLYWQILKQDSRIEVHQASELLDSKLLTQYQKAFDRVKAVLVPYHPTAKAAQLKDLLMWYALREYGGMFLDMDTLSYRAVWSDFVASGKSFAANVPATGVLLALPGSPVVNWIIETLDRELLRGDLFSDGAEKT